MYATNPINLLLPTIRKYPPKPVPNFFWQGTGNNNTGFLYSRNPTTGELTLVRSTVPASRGTHSLSAASFSHDGQYLAAGRITNGTNQTFVLYKVVSGDITELGLYGPVGGTTIRDLSWDPTDTYLAAALANGVTCVFKRNGDSLSFLNTLATGAFSGCTWSPDGEFLAICRGTTTVSDPLVRLYTRSGDSFSLVSGGIDEWPVQTDSDQFGKEIIFSPDGTHLLVRTNLTGAPYVYKRNGGVFQRIIPAGLVTEGFVRGMAFSPNGQFLAIGRTGTNFLNVYERSGDAYTLLTNPTQPLNQTTGLSFSGDGNYLLVGTATTSEAIFAYLVDYVAKTFTKVSPSPFSSLPTINTGANAHTPKAYPGI